MPSLPRRVPASLALAALAMISLAGCGTVQRDLYIEDRGRDVVPPPPRTSRKVLALENAYGVEYSFMSYDDEALTVRFQVDKSSYDAQDAGWGYSDLDLAALKAWRDAARQDAFAAATERRETQPKLDEDLARIQNGYRGRFDEYIASRGFVIGSDGVAKVDLAALARRGAARVAPLARELERHAAVKGRGMDWFVGAATSLVQTAIEYREVPAVVDGFHTGGVWTPTKTLIEGWGDCDTKVALLGAILSDWPGIKLIVIALPDHFVLGLARKPVKGESYVRWRGSVYVLIEAAGPAWLPPGYLGDGTKLMFESGRGYAIEPVL